ncbi:iron only hydrogenase large subunit-like protein [Bradyrhizobium sp. USDA 4524]|uniref:hypothetical protein n=1 Tax=unclassified Bradyrhizobium TaxID=2631580 RepID=UPI0020A1A0B6|nr:MULTISPECIES: hypothetical protein [unclassified Bradyrhizobium]MCP1845780.1 iron only hydrogenase large subunit-like protein [Bradyrhizobium sp. USDA 4538]MCP1906897.1 iron only hydrogenase large subunit-like protein [Bradyrhizobium sp. USDA 4537]MCP1985372.1 iron only hydrogenase large subunit-like protein [Bradyrhizobium sp. USDA 4539]
MTFSKHQFRVELRRLIEKHISSSSTFEDYVLITEELEEALDRLDLESEKFPDEEVDACEL